MGGAICGVYCGFLLFFGSFWVLGTNEKRAVQTAETIDMGRKAVVQSDSCRPSSMNDGKLVSMVACAAAPGHFPGAVHSGRATDQALLAGLPSQGNAHLTHQGYIGDNVLSWQRTAEQYQYIESSHTTTTTHNGEKTSVTVYSYSKGWSSVHQTWRCSQGCVRKCRQDLGWNEPCQETSWSHQLSDTKTGQVDRIYLSDQGSSSKNLWIGGNSWGDSWVPVVGHETTLSLSGGAGDQGTLHTCDGTHLMYPSPPGGAQRCYSKVGDWRFKWTYRTVPSSGVSVLAEQEQAGGGGRNFDKWDTGREVTYLAESGIGMVQDGACDGTCMLDEMEETNTIMTWVLRVVGFLLMFCGLQMIVAPFALAPEIIPCVGEMIGGVIGGALMCVNCCMAMALSTMTIAIAWLWVRPLIGIPLLLLCSACTAGGAFLAMQERKKAKGAAPEKQGFAQPTGAYGTVPPPPPPGYPPYPPGGQHQGGNPYQQV
eukprot:TRINITY_DN39253_c0_g1_i1.p1 TRINITY_DN39253_c0_g1~~TRINITY_DN39253_c0_g1_i1.p1  ORF type:complete len:548 (+),score=192.86 TRINITY_DN39253_c0_g1_i1:200-1645(+)